MPRPSHVAINALYLEPGRSAGTETYLRGLVPALARSSPDVRFTVLTTRKGAAALRADGWTDFCTLVQLRCDEGQRGRRLWAEQVTAPVLAARRGDVDLVHSLANLGPVRSRTRTVVTLHDVNVFHHRTFSLATTLAMRAIIREVAARAQALVTGTAVARDDIVATLGVPAERIVVAHHGAGRAPDVAPLSAGAVRERRGLADGSRIVFCLAAMRPHKNQALLIRALPSLPDDLVLVLAGHPEPYVEELRSLASSLGVASRVRIAGYVEDAELEGLWGMAACAAFPTLGEGFGLPVVEALARGVPVACSDLPVLREVSGGLAARFDPADPASCAAAILRAIEGTERARAEGPAWAGRFTWEAAAERTFEAYEQAMAA